MATIASASLKLSITLWFKCSCYSKWCTDFKAVLRVVKFRRKTICVLVVEKELEQGKVDLLSDDMKQ